jgi:hypothetical protein
VRRRGPALEVRSSAFAFPSGNQNNASALSKSAVMRKKMRLIASPTRIALVLQNWGAGHSDRLIFVGSTEQDSADLVGILQARHARDGQIA